MKNVLYTMVCGAMISACTSGVASVKSPVDYCRYVNPLIGTADNGHTYPGATTPFGLVQASPETGNDGWKYCSGFNYADDSIIGFAQTHLSGTGGPGLGDILLFPFSGKRNRTVYKSGYNKKTQYASAGYYTVCLTEDTVQVEITATPRTAFYRFVYKKGALPRLLVDLQNGIAGWGRTVNDLVLKAEMNMPNSCTIVGHNEVETWVKRHYFYAICFDKTYRVEKTLPIRSTEKAKRLVLAFDSSSVDTLQVKVGLSTVSIEGALSALDKENPEWNFEQVKQQTQAEWNTLLSRVEVEGTEEEKINFYTSLYHAFIQPNNLTDCDGKYRGANDSVAVASTGEYYSTFSLWDTYRAAHPLYTILVPERVDGMVQTMLSHWKVTGILPIWTLWGKENFCMIGNHSIPVIVDAYLKGFKGFEPDEAYRAIRQTLLLSHFNSDWETYVHYGYYPFDIVKVESVSRTLESAFDDYCAALMAKAMGKMDDYEMFLQRANYYRNLLDPSTKLMRGKDSAGHWREPFNSLRLSHATTAGGDYTEGNAWQYTWHVQHDVEGLMELMGGPDVFTNKLDSLFFLESHEQNTGFTEDVTGLIGQYAHGNEPSHHVAYLYNYAGQSWKTQHIIREIFDRFYLPKPDGLCGNDDCGQMSAWYIFSALGFYPVNPVGLEYILGAPQLPKAIIRLPEDRTLIVKALNLSKENKYVESVCLNGKKIYGYKLQHKDILQGGTLTFTMTDKPNTKIQ